MSELLLKDDEKPFEFENSWFSPPKITTDSIADLYNIREAKTPIQFYTWGTNGYTSRNSHLIKVELDSSSYICIPLDLREIYESIYESKKFLFDEAYADELELDIADESVYENAVQFLCDYANYIYNETSFDKRILKRPYIGLMPEGEVSIEWNSDHADFLILFKKNSRAAYFYGINKSNGMPFKSGIVVKDPVDPTVATWLGDHLT